MLPISLVRVEMEWFDFEVALLVKLWVDVTVIDDEWVANLDS